MRASNPHNLSGGVHVSCKERGSYSGGLIAPRDPLTKLTIDLP